jgi:4-amino-4-deoxy-L-arabinose transferase-like glycosyltransferase
MTKKPIRDAISDLVRRESVLLALLIASALALRLWALADVPPGWRDDELSNSLVISQHVLDGDLRLFYPDASGHEFLYHAVNALFLRLFGPGVWGIRLLSVLLGTGVVGLTYLLARRMFERPVAWIAALSVTTSFWALMYSRIGQRHISAVFFALAGFLFLWRALIPEPCPPRPRDGWINAALAGVMMGIGFYTYFASRITPVVVACLAVYLALFDRERLRRQWRVLALTLVVAGVLYLPLWRALLSCLCPSRPPRRETGHPCWTNSGSRSRCSTPTATTSGFTTWPTVPSTAWWVPSCSAAGYCCQSCGLCHDGWGAAPTPVTLSC